MHRCLNLLGSNLRTGDQVLEIGCGDGALLALLRNLGVKPMGLEMDRESAEATARSLQIPVRVGTFEEAEFHGRLFNAVVLIHIIEHFYEPVEMLRKVRSLLQSGGMVFLETPNILRPKVGPGRVFSFAHNYHFAPRTLALALYQAGFRCTALREFRRDSFQIVAHAAGPGDIGQPPLVQPWQEVQRAFRNYRTRYLTTFQFFWRKLPWFKEWLIYRLRRDLSGSALQNWLTTPRPGKLVTVAA